MNCKKKIIKKAAVVSSLMLIQAAVWGANPKVKSVDVVASSNQNVSTSTIYSFIKLKPGDPYTQGAVDQSIHALYKTGLFEYIKSDTDRDGDQVVVTFSVIPKYRLTELKFEGNKAFSGRRLKKEIGSEVSQPLDEAQLKNDIQKLKAFYEKKGYPNIDVDYALEKDDEAKAGSATFKVDEGEKVRISSIKFKGNKKLKSKDLKEVIHTSPRHLFSWITGSGRIREDRLKNDAESLLTYYRNQGYLDAEVNYSDIEYDYVTPSRINLIFNVKEGEQYYVGDISIVGNSLYTTKQLFKHIKLAKDALLSPAQIESDRETIQNIYGHYGYLDTAVYAERVPNLKTGKIDVNFKIEEGEKNYVEAVNIQGNYRTQAKVILRELALSPGDTFNMTRMRNSEAKLKNTGYFDEVNLSPEPTSHPGRKDLRIVVKEARTGNISFGGGFSSLEKGMIFVEFAQSNFDLFNYRTRFRGAGQKFRMRAQLGQRATSFLIAFEEPWAFQRELVFGTELFRTRTQFVSSNYNELRYGLELYFRKNLFELVEGKLSYRYEAVNIFDVKSNVSQLVKDEAGTRKISKFGFMLERDLRDNFITPSEGNLLRLVTEWAGAGGDVKYFRYEGHAGQWFTTFDTGEQILQLMGKAGSVFGYDKKKVPLFDRYFLGGPDNLRGFDYRKVGPNSQGEPIGGSSFAYATAEYSFRLAKPVRFAVFYDTGFVNERKNNYTAKDYRDDWGVGLRVMLMGAPLRLDLGFPIRRDASQGRSPEFNFSFGTNF